MDCRLCLKDENEEFCFNINFNLFCCGKKEEENKKGKKTGMIDLHVEEG
jgi:hypothetical protein